MGIQRVKSKWAKTNALLQSDTLSGHIPETIQWSREGLQTMLDECGMLYVKPDQGTFGGGVIRIEKVDEDHYTYQLGTKLRTFPAFVQMADRLERELGSRPYLIQKGIELLKYNGRRFDIRVMVQKNLRDRWETTGIIGRLGHPLKVVTNYHSGGKPMTFETLMGSHLSPKAVKSYNNWLRTLGVSVASQLQTVYPRIKEIGIDIAVDTDFNPWILEVNTMPDPYLFRKLPDKKVYLKVSKYCKAYGRFRKKKRSSPRKT
ncbi:YheC/YheD family protein [Paenibacillus humicola]|uniref:YheC/YheD family protein n=1 Tax=Paenibacillus humicola TaxID=3110540 RepID=UPI00237B3CD9|nr:YheC/YheD family protein [Paenibacillus humicola]